MDNQKNLLLAVDFSIAVLVGFDFFFGPNKTVQKDNIIDNSEAFITRLRLTLQKGYLLRRFARASFSTQWHQRWRRFVQAWLHQR